MVNIFSTLSKYGAYEAENYLTESFVYVLTLLLNRLPKHGLQILENLTDIDILDQSLEPNKIKLETQVSLKGGIFDIVITGENRFLTFIEVKHDSPLGEGQLEYYKELLEQSDYPQKSLVLLTRSRFSAHETELTEDEYHHVCWYEVHYWIKGILGNDEVVDFIASNFLKFLEEKKMSLPKISLEYERGVSSMIDLSSMIESALGEVFPKSKIKCSAGWSWRGFYLDEKYFIGVRFNEPTILVFENNQGTKSTFKKDFVLKESHFFLLDASDQFEALIKYFHDVSVSLEETSQTA